MNINIDKKHCFASFNLFIFSYFMWFDTLEDVGKPKMQ